MTGTNMQSGRIKWYDPKLGYGYVTPSDGSPDVFVHFTALDASGLTRLSSGQVVHFEKKIDGGLTRAARLSVAEAA